MTDRNVSFAMQSGDPGAVNAQPQQQHQQHQQQSPPGTAPGTKPWSKAHEWMVGWRGSRQLVLVIVAIALLLDNMLLTVVGKWIFLNCYFDNNYTTYMIWFYIVVLNSSVFPNTIQQIFWVFFWISF